MKARMLRFYNGMAPDYVDELSVYDFYQYWQSITEIESQEMLNKLLVADYPNMKPDKRREVYNNLKRTASSRTEEKRGAMSPMEIAKMIGRING